MYSAAARPLDVDPWVAPRGRLESSNSLSRQAAERSSVLQALRERRNAARPVRPVPRPAQVEPVGSGVADGDARARHEDLTSVG